jgi:CCR4-NOT transcriptional regulation complex NOT5 subunit
MEQQLFTAPSSPVLPQPLMDVRKSIERDMERFKACERESKIKGINRVYNDPKEKAREEARDWINTTVDALQTKVRACMSACVHTLLRRCR